MLKIAVLVSGGGTNLQALLDAQARGEFEGGGIALVISSEPEAFALQRAEKAGVPTRVLCPRDFENRRAYSQALIAALEEAGVGLIVLAGFLVILSRQVTERFSGRIINVHPSLIPSFCGEGYYGLKVHQAALDYGVKVTGATVHLVNEVTDGGKILLQKAVEVHPDDTAESLQRRVMEEAEWVLLPRAVAMFCRGEL